MTKIFILRILALRRVHNTLTVVQKFNLKNPQWKSAAIFKAIKCYFSNLYNHMIDFNRILNTITLLPNKLEKLF